MNDRIDRAELTFSAERSVPNVLKELIAAVAGGLLGAVATLVVQRWLENGRTLEQRRFSVYMLLLELRASHFRIVSSESHGEDPPVSAIERFASLKWRIADELRQADKLPELERVLCGLLSLQFRTERDRFERLERITDEMGGRANRRYQQAIRKITEENQALLFKDFDEFHRRQHKVDPI